MFLSIRDNADIGEYLDRLIRNEFGSRRRFCKAFQEMLGGDTDDVSLNNLNNKMTQIVKGKKSIQIRDLPIITNLLHVSCEELLSCGKAVAPDAYLLTNYQVARSDKLSLWETYLSREDKPFLNADEYGKTLIDYALNFKNYNLMKYLMDEGYIWFVGGENAWEDQGFGFGAGTSIKPRKPGDIDTRVPLQLRYEDRLRTDTIALAIMNGAHDTLEELHAREIPAFYNLSFTGNRNVKFVNFYNKNLIDAIYRSSKDMIEYFASDFEIVTRRNERVRVIFPFIGEVIEEMIRYNKCNVELALNLVIEHNKSIYLKLSKLIDDGQKYRRSLFNYEIDSFMDNDIRDELINGINVQEESGIVSFYYLNYTDGIHGLASNVVKIGCKSKNPKIAQLIKELNEWYDRIVLKNF